ncbi:MAG: hypothetical protein FJ267_01885 [Planctomycetes bacterium]|nr:hypothetical protein [Planctomycetota bacterium]
MRGWTTVVVGLAIAFSFSILATDQVALPKKLYRGKVVLVTEALKRRGVKASTEELKNQVVLETENELIPILPDWRGRAFFQDERLRDRDVELIGFIRPGLPYLSVLSVYTFDDEGHRTYTDYWCDVCSIPMYELKPCDCCQEEIRLRFERQELPKEFRENKKATPISK